jgi:hypothetical protein
MPPQLAQLDDEAACRAGQGRAQITASRVRCWYQLNVQLNVWQVTHSKSLWLLPPGLARG